MLLLSINRDCCIKHNSMLTIREYVIVIEKKREEVMQK